MKHSRITLASTLALGVTLGLQPLSVSFTAQMLDTAGAIAKGGEGNGGGGGHGGGGGDRGGEGGRGSAGEARGGGHGSDKSNTDSSVAERGNKDGARSGSARGHAGGGSNRGNSEPKGLLEGFLSDVRSATGLGRSGREAQKSTAASKSTKSPERKTTVTTTTTDVSTTPPPASEKTSIGRLNAAHAVANGNTNAARNSAVGQIAVYAEALRDYSTAKTAANEATMKEAAAALDRVANKPLTAESIEALNEILGLGDVAAEDVMKAVETARKADEDDTSTTSADASVEQ